MRNTASGEKRAGAKSVQAARSRFFSLCLLANLLHHVVLGSSLALVWNCRPFTHINNMLNSHSTALYPEVCRLADQRHSRLDSHPPPRPVGLEFVIVRLGPDGPAPSSKVACCARLITFPGDDLFVLTTDSSSGVTPLLIAAVKTKNKKGYPGMWSASTFFYWLRFGQMGRSHSGQDRGLNLIL